MRRHLIGDEYFFHIVKRIKNLRYVRAANCFLLGSFFPEKVYNRYKVSLTHTIPE